MPGTVTIFLSILCLALLAVWVAMLIAEPRLIRRSGEYTSDSGLPYASDCGSASCDGGGDGGGGD